MTISLVPSSLTANQVLEEEGNVTAPAHRLLHLTTHLVEIVNTCPRCVRARTLAVGEGDDEILPFNSDRDDIAISLLP